jgi:hypothetical protein
MGRDGHRRHHLALSDGRSRHHLTLSDGARPYDDKN